MKPPIQKKQLLTFVTITTTKFFSSILYSLRAVSSLRILPEKLNRQKLRSCLANQQMILEFPHENMFYADL